MKMKEKIINDLKDPHDHASRSVMLLKAYYELTRTAKISRLYEEDNKKHKSRAGSRKRKMRKKK